MSGDTIAALIVFGLVAVHYHHKSKALAKEVDALKAQLRREGLEPAQTRPEVQLGA